MRRWLIAGGIVVVVLGSVLAIAAANLGRFLGAHRDRLADRVEREVGRAVEFGDVGLTLWGGPGVRVADVRVLEDPEWGGGDLLRADELLVTVRLLPALAGRFEIRRIALHAPVLTVIRDGRGWNLETLGRRRAPRPPGPPSGRKRASIPLLIGLAGVEDGEIRLLDRRHEPPQEVVVRQLRVSASDVVADGPIAFTAEAAVLGAADRNLEIGGHVGPVGDGPAEQTPVDLRWTLDGADAEALARSVTVLDLIPPRDLIVAGPLSGRGELRGRLDALAAEATLDASPAALRLGTTLAKPPALPLVADVAVDRQGAVLAVRRGTLRLGDATLDAVGSIGLAAPRTVDLRLDSNRAPLATLARVLAGAGVTDANGTVEAHLTVQATSGEVPAIAGTVVLADVAASRASDGLGVSDLSTTITVADGVARMPVSPFRSGAAHGELSGSYQLRERVLAGDGKAADVFGGTVEGRARVELADHKQPRFTVAGSARGVALGPLLAARASPLAPHVAGSLDADVALAGAGVRRRAVRRSLTGTARVDVRDGVLRGLNLVDAVIGAATGFERGDRLVPAGLRRRRPELFGAADTQFEELRATARIAERRAITDDLVLRTASYAVTGSGWVGFDGQTDLRARFVAGPELTADVLGSVKDARWALNAEQRVEVPLQIAGRFPELRPRPDPDFVARVLGRALEARARKALRGNRKPDEERNLVDDAIRGLERLFGR